MINPTQRPLPDNTQHSQQTNIRAPGGIRTYNLSRQATAVLRLRPHRRCCLLVPRHQQTASSVHYTTSCTQSSSPEDGRNYRSKHVELIEIINKLLLLHLVGVYIIVSVMHGHTNTRHLQSIQVNWTIKGPETKIGPQEISVLLYS